MKRLLTLLACLMLLFTKALAQEAAEPLKLAEIEQFNQVLLERAIQDELPPFETEGGFMVRGAGYEVLLAGGDVSADSVVLGAALLLSDPGHEGGDAAGALEGPRGSLPGMDLAALLALYPNDNPSLAGTRDSAVLYMAGQLPSAVSVGFLLRDGQELRSVEHDVYYQAGGGVVRAGIQYTLEQGRVVAVRSFVSQDALSQQQAAEELAAFSALQEQDSYVAYDGDNGRLTREDLVLGGLDFFDTDPEQAALVLGEPANREALDDSEGGQLLILQWPGFEAVFSQKDGAARAQRLTANGGAFEGPRGLRLGDTLAQAISCFEHPDTLNQEGGALYGDAVKQVPPYGLMAVGPESTVLYYVIEAGGGKAGLMLEFIDDLLVSLTITYL